MASPQDSPNPSAAPLYPEDKDTAPTGPSPSAPSNTPMSASGFAENVMGQLHEIGKGLINMWPTAIKSGVQLGKYATDPFVSNDLGTHLLDSVSDTASHVASGIAGPESDYAKYGLSVGYYKPLTPVLDAMTVLSLGGGMVGKAGKLAGGVSRAGMAADDVAKLGQMGMADRLATMGDHIAQIPERIGKAVAEAPLKMVGVNPDSLKAMRTYEGESKSWANQAKYDQGERFNQVFKGFSQADKEALDRMAMEGATQADRAQFPKAAAALDEWKNFLSEREATLGENGRGLLTPDAMGDVVAKKYANRKYGAVTDQTVEAAKGDIAAMAPADRPVYTPAIGERAEHSILDLVRGKEEVIPPGSGTGFLKPFKGTGDRISDPTVYMRKGASQFIDMEQKLRFMDNVIRDPKLTRIAAQGDKTLADVMPEGFYRKYAADSLRAQGKGLAELAVQNGVQNAPAELAKYLSDPVVSKYVDGLKGIAAQNTTVGNYVKYAFMRQPEQMARFLKIYDKVMGLFKTTGTVASPRWHVANVVGDAVLSTMAGEYGLNWRLMRQAVSSMPPFLREGGKYISMEIGNWEQRYLTKLSDVTQAADDLARRGVWTNEVAGKFKQAAASFAAADGSLEDFVKHVGQAHTDLPGLQSGMQQLDEQIARNSKRIKAIDAEIDALKRQLTSETQAPQGAAILPKKKGLSPDVIADFKSKLEAIRSKYTGTDAVKVFDEMVPKVVAPSSIEDEGLRFLTKRSGVYDPYLSDKLSGLRSDPVHGQIFKQMRDDLLQLAEDFAEQKRAAGIHEAHPNLKIPGESSPIVLTNPKGQATVSAKIDELYNTRQNLVADRRHKLIQSGQVEQALPGVQKYAEVSRQGIERGNAFLGDYLSLGPVERSVFRRVIPFYAWTKAMAKLTFTLPFIAPKTAFFWHRWSEALSTMAGDKSLPDYMKTYAPIGSTMANGKPALLWVDATAVSHFGKFFQTRFGDVPIPNLLAFWKENPFLQTGYRLIGGRDEFYWAGRPQNGQVWVSAGDGTVKRFRPDGRIEQVVPQAPVVKTLAHMFPAVQMQEQLTAPYDLNKGPALNPDGSYRFPKELWQRVTELFGPKTKVGNPDEIRNNELRSVQDTLRQLQKMYPKATPEEREYIRGVFEDYQKGMFRRMKTGA